MMEAPLEVLDWLLEGDPAIRWQVQRDLLAAPSAVVAGERQQTTSSGWGADLLQRQDPDGKWGGGLYSPKWTSTTYTLLLLHRIGIPPEQPQALSGCQVLLDRGLYADGGINFSPSFKHSETCITGMVLSLLAYFHIPDTRFHSLAEHLLERQLPDGGWNCRSYYGDTHSSFHTTISVLEGLFAYEQWQPHDLGSVQTAQARGREFLLVHGLFKSHRTGEVFDARMTRFSFPPRWHYDVLRGLDYFQACRAPHDSRLLDALELLQSRRKKDGRWLLQNRHSGRTFFEMEAVGQPSRWNTLRALRVLRWWDSVAERSKS